MFFIFIILVCFQFTKIFSVFWIKRKLSWENVQHFKVVLKFPTQQREILKIATFHVPHSGYTGQASETLKNCDFPRPAQWLHETDLGKSFRLRLFTSCASGYTEQTLENLKNCDFSRAAQWLNGTDLGKSYKFGLPL